MAQTTTRKDKAMEFNGKRLGFLFNIMIEESKREFIIGALVFLITGIFATQLEVGEAILVMALMVGYFVSVCENSFKWYKVQNKRINSLLLPASACEKYTAIFILNLVAPAVVMFLFTIAGVGLGNMIFADCSINPSDILAWFEVFKSSEGLLVESVLLAMTSVCFYGSLFFKKVAFANLIGYAGLSFIAFHWIKEYITRAYMPAWNSPYRESFIDAYRNVMDYFGIGLNVVIFVGFMVLTYLRLKEERS